MIETVKNNDYCLVKLELDEASLDKADEFKEKMIGLIDDGNYFIVISFEKVLYIDSTFMAALVSVLKYAISKKGDIAFAQLPKDITYLFRMIRMDRIFTIFKDLPESFTGNFRR